VIAFEAAPGLTARLAALKRRGAEIEQALDIGAYHGDFTAILKSIWPWCRVQQFEADERCKSCIPGAKFVLLGDRDCDAEFFTLPEGANTSGSSLFRENTAFYAGPVVKTLPMKRLDFVADYSGDWSKGLVKIDTQGAELLILKGAPNLLERRPRFMLLECSIQQYNLGAPLADEIVAWMRERAYQIRDVCEIGYDEWGGVVQTSILFEKAS
jgi:FkbM family methyltransferase